MKKLTFFLCAIFLTMVGFSHGNGVFADIGTARIDGGGTFSSFQGLTWSPNGQLTWTGVDEARTLAGPGDTCIDPAVITSLPFTVTDNTGNYGDDYESGDRPPLAPGAVGNPSASYLGGDDVVYAYTPTANGLINIYVSNHGSWTGLFVFTGCPFASTVGGHTSSSASTVLTVESLPVTAGETYYIVISTWPTPQSTDYTLTVEADVFDCPELEANIGDPCDDGDPNTVGDSINADCECVGIVPGPGSDCASAVSLVCNADPVTYSSVGSTATNTTTCSMGNAGLWFTFTGTGNTITVNSTASFDHEMSINSGSCENLTNIACKDGSTTAETYTLATTVAGQAYYVYIAHYASGNTTTGDITVSLVCATDFDCPELQKNIGDSCDLGGGETGVVDADCNCAEVSCQNSTKYPSAAVTPDPTGAVTTISTCQYWTEYSEINSIISGYDYQFDSVKNGTSAYVTVREGSFDGPVVGKGYGPLTVTATSSANLFVHWTTNADCDTGTGCAVSTVSCVTCANAPDCEGVPGGPAQPGTPCDDGNPDTINDVYDEDCNCAGTMPAPGDDCSMAISLECGAEAQTYSSANSVATNTTTCTMGAKGIWFSFQGTGADITVNSSATFDHEMSINTGSCDELVNIVCKDSSTGAETYTVAATVAGQTYYVYIAHYSSSSSTTGDITISLDCATVPECVPPTLTAYASDEVGEPISGCLEAGDQYYVYATLEGGEGNSSYYVTANGGDAVEVEANDSVNLGPFTVGTNVTVNAVGVQDGDCSVSASVTSPVICPPSNDDCDNATPLACGQPITGSTVNATASGLPATCNGYTSSSALDVFYSFEADGTSDYTVSLDAASGNSFDGILFIYSGACGELTSIECSDSGNPEEVTLTAPAAGTYTVRVYRYSGTGNFTLGLECSAAPECVAPELTLTAQDANGAPVEGCIPAGGEYYVLATLSGGSGNTSYYVAANDYDAVEVDADGSVVFGPFDVGTTVNASALGVQDDDCVAYATLESPAVCGPDNDDCDGAIALVCGETVSGTTVNATASGLPATCNGYTSSSALDVFYSFEADGTSDYTVSLDAASGNSFDGILFIYSGACGELTSIECSDSGNPEEVTLTAPAAGTYTVRVFRYSGTGNFTLGLECSAAPECVAPELTLTAQDVNGAPVEGCIPAGGEYYVLATLSGGSGNTSYYVAANDYDAVEVDADGSVVFGPFDVGTTVNASALGVQDDDCVTYATLESPAVCGPDNDNCEGAIALSCGDSVEGTTINATYSGMTDDCTFRTTGDVFYSLAVEAGSEYTVTVVGDDYDAVLAIYSGSCGELTEIACADNGFSAGMPETITFTADATETLVIRTYDWSSSAGSFTISVECGEGPSPCGEGAFVTTWKTSADNELITIPTFPGETYDYTVEWGDGSMDSNVSGNVTHTYANAGTYTVSICGTFPRIYLNNDAPDRNKLRSIEQWGNNVWASMNGAFAGAQNLVSNATDMPDLSMVTDMYGMFAFARSFNGDANIGNWDVSNVTDMYGMFAGASVFNADINNWDVSNVDTMENMFYGATLFNQDLGSWNVGNVTNMKNTFATAMNFNGDISNWDVSSVDTMYGMFFHANNFDRDLGNWDVSNVTDMRNMFKNVKLSVANYDSLLMGWSALPLQSNVKFNAGKSKYCAGEMARQSIIANYGWTITDQGLDCTLPGPKDIYDQASLADVTLYPNPMVSNLTLSNPKHVNIDSIAIYDLAGRLVKTVNLKGMTSDVTLDVSTLSSATYMVKIIGESGQVSKLLIKE